MTVVQIVSCGHQRNFLPLKRGNQTRKAGDPQHQTPDKQTNTPSLSQWRIEEAGDVGNVSCWRSIAGHGPAITSR
jgi:hypothetical protein